jgi:hypothetical protein
MFLYQLDKDSTAYNLSGCIRFTGSLDIAALEQSFNAVIQRHESLRTAVAEKEEAFIQVIAPNLNISIETVFLQQMSESDKSAEVLRRSAEEVRRPFDPEKGPLLHRRHGQMARGRQYRISGQK